MGRCYPHLSLEERRKLAKWREAKMLVPEIADRLGRAPSTIYREIKRNHFEDDELPYLSGYYGVNAQRSAEARRARRRGEGSSRESSSAHAEQDEGHQREGVGLSTAFG